MSQNLWDHCPTHNSTGNRNGKTKREEEGEVMAQGANGERGRVHSGRITNEAENKWTELTNIVVAEKTDSEAIAKRRCINMEFVIKNRNIWKKKKQKVEVWTSKKNPKGRGLESTNLDPKFYSKRFLKINSELRLLLNKLRATYERAKNRAKIMSLRKI